MVNVNAAGSIVANKGDPFEAIKSLASVNTVKSLATSMLSAGLLDQVSKGFNLNLTSMSKNEFLAKLEYNLAKNSVGAAVNMSIYGKYEQGVIGGVVDALLGTALSPMLQKVEDITTIGKFSESNQRLVRAVLTGGVQSAITGGDLMDRMLSGIAEELVAAKCKGIVEGRVTDSAQVNLREQGSKIEEIAEDAIVGGEEVKASSKELEALDLAVSTGSADECIEQDHQDTSSELIKELDLDPGLGKKLLIGAGRALVKTWQGLKQLGLAIGEKLQFVKDGATEEYTSQINSEKILYEETPVGSSGIAKTGEVLTDLFMAAAIPGGAGSKGVRLVADAAITGAVIGGVQMTEDGSLSSRAENAAIGARRSSGWLCF